jgi:hypothetical protein
MQPTCIKKDRMRGSNRQQGAADGRGCGGAHDEELNVVPARARAPPLVADSRMGRSMQTDGEKREGSLIR